MAKTITNKDKNEDENEDKVDSRDLLARLLKENKDNHYQHLNTPNYKVSTGSLKLDRKMSGGFGPGVHRLVGFTEGGKEQPISEPVLTPFGWKTIGSLKVGDSVMDADGETQKIIGVYPQGKKDVYKVLFDDGSETKCGLEHLWETSSFLERKRKDKSVKSLDSIKKTLHHGTRFNHSVRLVKPVNFQEKKLLVNPYLLGALIGCGEITESIALTNTDQEILNKIEDILSIEYSTFQLIAVEKDGVSQRIISLNQNDNLLRALKTFNLHEKRSDEKFIPQEYKTSSISQRLNLLHGLIDTNGHLNPKKSEVMYYTTSDQLAEDIVDLVRSLGGIAKKKRKNTFYIDENGKRKTCENCKIVSFYLPKTMQPCSLTRKLKNYSNRTINFLHFIKDVQLVGKEECVCIKVSSKDSLYVTRDYLLTHNTSAAFAVMLNFMKDRKKRKVFYVKAEGRLSPEVQQRSGLKFVFKPEDWIDGTVFVFKCNVFETIASMIRSIIQNNDEEYEYGFILDSMDSLNRLEDINRSFSDTDRVAGGAQMTSVFMKKLNLPLCEAGHMTFLISQVRSEIKIDMYAKTANKGGMFSGGNAALHYPNWILEFQPRWSKDFIYENPEATTPEKRGATLGKLVKVKIDKSTNETTGDFVDYPIKHGRLNGTSIWVEREIVEELITRAIVYPKGAWLYWTDMIFKELTGHFGEIPVNFNGRQKLYDYVENHLEIRDFLYNFLVNL